MQNTKCRILAAIFKINKNFPVPKSPAEIGINNDKIQDIANITLRASLNRSYSPGLSVGRSSSEAGSMTLSPLERTTLIRNLKQQILCIFHVVTVINFFLFCLIVTDQSDECLLHNILNLTFIFVIFFISSRVCFDTGIWLDTEFM